MIFVLLAVEIWQGSMDDNLASRLLGSIATDNLIVFAGAGLSMAAPSRVPSAAALAQSSSAEYELQTGVSLPPAAKTNLEELCKYALANNQLYGLLLEKIVNWAPFRHAPNKGHDAVADLLATKALFLGITTNVDVLVEEAARNLGEGDFMSALDGNQAAIERLHQTYLKIHGCAVRDRENTLWCREQLVPGGTLITRIESSKAWLAGKLIGKDLIFVGFWSDWDYLNQIFESCVLGIEPRHIVLVDPQTSAVVQAKAPKLWAWANDGKREFFHERVSGADFLDELRRRFSSVFLERVINQAKPAYTAITGKGFARTPAFPTTLTTDDLYSLRRDIAGVPGTQVARDKVPMAAMELIGTIHMRLMEKGAAHAGSRYVLDSKRVRVIQAAGRVLSQIRKQFEEEIPALPADDMVICAGATDDGGAASHVIKSGTTSSVVRPTHTARWLPHEQAIAELTI